MISRRTLLRWTGGLALGGESIAGYAAGIEPFRLVETHYTLTPPGWPPRLRLKLAVLADIHACNPWMTADRVAAIAARANALNPDVTLLLGDYVVAHKWISGRVPAQEWAAALACLKAPFGVHAVLGNHDWWDDRTAQRQGHGPTESHRALLAAGIAVHENDAVRLTKDVVPFWLAGLGDQFALLSRGSRGLYSRGVDDLSGTLAKVTDAAPVILMAHEPDAFPRVPPRVSLTISGHTHGGQLRAFGRVLVSPYSQPEPYAYGHFTEYASRRFPGAERNLIFSGGLGCSVMPVRLGVPPEIVVIELGHGVGA